MLPPIVTFLIVLSVVVLIHELGHYLAAKMIGVKVEEFGFGYPPKALGKKIGETLYSINWLPLGGFVRLYGEQEADAPGTRSERAFFNKKKRKRSMVLLAGVFMNLLLAVVLFSTIYSINGIPKVIGTEVRIGGISPGSPAQEANLELGDKVVAIDGRAEITVDEFVNYLKDKGGEEVKIDVERLNGDSEVVTLVPRLDPPEGEGAVGVLVSEVPEVESVFYPAWQMPFRGTWFGLQEAYGWLVMLVGGIAMMFKQLFSGITPEVAGPVGIFQLTSTVAEQGVFALMRFTAILSVNLAIVNALPFPALDGGRFVFVLLEGVIGKRIKPKIEAYINMVGMILLLGLMAVITGHEILKTVKENEVTIFNFLPKLLGALFTNGG
jgi:regulator of sigma E protease